MNIAKLIEKGEDAFKKKNYDYSISIFMEAVSFAPNDRRAREGLRKAELKKHEPSYPGALAVSIFGMGAKLGMFFAGLGKKANPEAYMMACEKFLRIDPKNKKVNMALGDAAANAGYLNAAIFAFETVADHHGGDIQALKRLGKLLWQNGDMHKAHEMYDRAVRLNPHDQEAVKARKNLAAEVSLKETGFETAKSSQELVKDKVSAGQLEQADRLYQSEDDLLIRRTGLEQKLEEDKDNVDLWQQLADVCRRERDWDAAVEAMDNALKVQPDDLGLQFARGDLVMDSLDDKKMRLLNEGKEEEAKKMDEEVLRVRTEEFRKRIAAYPTDLNLRFKLADLLLKQGDLDGSISEFQQTVRDPKFRSMSQLRLGQAFAAKGQHELAVRQLDQAKKGQTGMTDRMKEICYELGLVYGKMGDPGKARAEFGQIYEVDINYRDVGDRISKLETP